MQKDSKIISWRFDYLIKFDVFIVDQVLHKLFVDASSKDMTRLVHSFLEQFLISFQCKRSS